MVGLTWTPQCWCLEWGPCLICYFWFVLLLMGKLAKLVVCFYVRWATMQVECGIFVDVGVAFGAIQIKGHKIVKVSKNIGYLCHCALLLYLG